MKLRQEDAFLAEAKSCSPELGRSRKSGSFPSPTEADPLILFDSRKSNPAFNSDAQVTGIACSCGTIIRTGTLMQTSISRIFWPS